MTIKSKIKIGISVLSIVVMGMLVVSNINISKIKEGNDKTTKIKDNIIHVEKIIAGHQKYAGALASSIVKNETFNSKSKHNNCILGKWYFPFKKTEEFKKLSKESKAKLIKMETEHKEIHGTAKLYRENYNFFNPLMREEILQQELALVVWEVVFEKKINKKYSEKKIAKYAKKGKDLLKFRTNYKQSKWNEFITEEKANKYYQNYNDNMKKLLDNATNAYKKMYEVATNAKKLHNQYKWEEAKKEFKKLKGMVTDIKYGDLSSLKSETRDYIDANQEIENKMINGVPKNLKHIIVGLEEYKTGLKEKERQIQKENKKTTNIVDIINIVSFLVIVLIIGTIFIFGQQLIKEIENLGTGLKSFFGFLNGKTMNIEKLNDKKTDEFGKIAGMINENVQNISIKIDLERNMIKEVQEVVNEVNNGSLESRVEAQTNTESLNDLRDSLNKMLESLESNVASNLIELEKTIGSYGNLDFTSKVNCKKGKMKDAINNLGNLVTEMLVSSQNISLELNNNANQLESNMTELASASNEQAASLEEVSASVEEISGNIAQSKEKASQVSKNAHEMKRLANTGSKDVTKMNEIIENVSESQNKISNAIQQIDQIAFQTNILSLNAAVEAATAGEHGKGFAVVAQEVRNLAARSAEAAEDIKKLVDTSSGLISESTELSSHVSVSFTKLVEAVEDTSTNIDEVYQTGKEQEDGINQISTTMSQLDQNTQENARMANETLTIALSTKESANTILEDMADKEFNGKQ